MNIVREKAVSRIVADVDAILAKPSNWVQGPMAVDKNGNTTGSLDEGAVGFCLYGAMRHAGVVVYSDAELDTLDYLQHVLQQTTRTRAASAIAWNEQRSRTFAQVKALLRAARNDFEPRFKS